MICFEFKIAEANWLTLLLLLLGESARNFNVIVLQHVNGNYSLKTIARISPYHFAYILPKCCDLLFLCVDCTGCRIQEITIMFWLVDMRLHFYFAASDFSSRGSGIPITYVQIRQNGVPKIKEMQVKLSWSVV